MRIAMATALILLGLGGLAHSGAWATEDGAQVFVIEVHGTIDLGLAPYTKRVLSRAEKEGARASILDINTPGGRLDAALQMKNAILDSKIPVIAFVNREAFSAGSLIALAADEIYMAPGAVMGAATPVDQSGEKASEKVVSAVRKDFKSLAELRGRDPQVAEAMVDEDVAIEGLVEEGKLLTLSAEEALRVGYAEGQTADLEGLLAVLDLTGATVIQTSPSAAEHFVRFLTNPILASFLISLGFLGLLFEITSPGFGVPGIAGLAMLGLFFWGHFLAGLAGIEGVALVVVGLTLIGVEVFLIPGFGIAGLLGIAAFFGGLFLSLIGLGADAGDYLRAVFILLGAVGVIAGGIMLLLKFVPQARLFRGLALQTSLPAGPGTEEQGAPSRVDMPTAESGGGTEAAAGPLLGARGVALTDLRPAGVARIDSQRVDVVSEGDFIPPGTPIEVIADEGYRRVVRAIEEPGAESTEGEQGASPQT